MKKNLLLLFGGCSTEYSVSCVSGASVLKNIDRDTYNVITVGITRDGEWYLTNAEPDCMAADEWRTKSDCVPAFISPDRGVHGIIILKNGGYEVIRIDIAFPVLHGKNGEDGTVQGLLSLAGIPCAGAGVLSSALCMDKAMAKAVGEYMHVPQAKWCACTKYEFEKSPECVMERFEKYLSYPMFIKPANAGSSVGISKVKCRADLEKAMKLAFTVDAKAVAEEFVNCREIEIALLGNGKVECSCCGEIVPANEFYDYEAKYENENSKLIIPAVLPDGVYEKIRETAVTMYKALDIRGFARADFFVTKGDSRVIFNEVNTIPGFTPISMYSKLFEKAGISYGVLISRILKLAEEQ